MIPDHESNIHNLKNTVNQLETQCYMRDEVIKGLSKALGDLVLWLDSEEDLKDEKVNAEKALKLCERWYKNDK